MKKINKTIDLTKMDKTTRANWIAWCEIHNYKYKTI